MENNLRFSLPESGEDSIPQELAELGQLLATVSDSQRPQLEQAFQRIVDSVRRRHKILMLVQEALSQLRLDIKYLMFDLEVTRRERDELRQQIDGQ